MAYKHGVYVTEKPTSLTVPIEGTAGLQVIFGTAPINLAKDPKAAVNTPLICYSYAEAVEKVGYSDDFKSYTLCQSISACFKVHNIAPIILINVLDPDNTAHVTVVSDETVAVSKHVGKISVAGILAATLVVTMASTTLEAGSDYTTVFDDDGYLTITTASNVEDGELTVSYTKLNPEGVTAEDIVGTATAGAEKGLEVLRQVFPKLGLTPGLLVAPGWSHLPVVAAALQAKCESINGCFSCQTITDISSDKNDTVNSLTYDAVKEAKEKTGVDDRNAYALWPMGKVGDKIYYLSALAAAVTAYTDANNGDVPNLSPSNKPLGITALCLADGTEVILDKEQANQINGYGVATAINWNGFKLWGNNTAAYPSTTDPKDRWFAVRRFFSWRENSFILSYHQNVDDPTNYRLVENLVDSENILGNSYVAQDYCAESRIEFSIAENPVTSILDGKIKFHSYLAPYVPTEVIENEFEFNPLALQSALAGGE